MRALLILCLLATLACNRHPNRIYEHVHDLPAQGWNWNQPMEFSVDLTDTLSRYNLYVLLRHTGNYAYSNCFMRLQVLAPDQREVEQRVELILADKKGEWLGHGMGDRRELVVRVGENLRMKEPGTYLFRLHQDMRDDPLKGVVDVGLFLEKSTDED